MQQVFDLIGTIKKKLNEYVEQTGSAPQLLSLSPRSYRKLIELNAWNGRVGNLIIGCAPIRYFETASGTVRLVIDELLSDAHICLS